jgi:DNA-binding NtrC family response regulator
MTTEVVFIDDEEDICELYLEFFDDDALHVTTFTNPSEAVSFMSANTVHVCFIDYRMPGMNGIDLREQLPDDVDYYLVTGELDLDCPEGFVGKFTKPFRLEELEKILETLLKHSVQ